ncbi:Cytochrome P450 89A2 [Apostasia shenzhenica]|uniref:Cytochrome P450 89A2 n=1 Tax=Apostasia shenzhenica TaxID=1088818 RepID=A0A2I0AYS9_9ASPA|nr:Cytochrome P450 89A2 [Apostasia shenzhenica]
MASPSRRSSSSSVAPIPSSAPSSPSISSPTLPPQSSSPMPPFPTPPSSITPKTLPTALRRHDISFSNYGPLWRLLRGNLLFQTLHPSRLGLFAPARRAALRLLFENLRSQSSSKIMVKENFRQAFFNLHILMCFGEKLAESEIREIESLQVFLLSLFTTFNIFAVLPEVTKVVYQKRWEGIVGVRQRQAEIFLSLINRRLERKQSREKENDVGTGDGGVDYCYVDSLLDLQLPKEGWRRLTVEEVVNLCHEFLSGVETTTTALEWTMAELVKHQEIQRKLFEEIESVVSGDQDLIEEEHLQRMPYLKAVVMEALRRHPPSHFVLPHSVKEDKIFNGYLIPKGAEVHFSVADVNWDCKKWKDPMEFRPERFMAGEEGEGVDITGKKEIKMLTFGAGKRMCPGQGLAVLHMEFMVANLVREFEWKEGEGEEVNLSEKLEFTTIMKNPLRAIISPRKRGQRIEDFDLGEISQNTRNIHSVSEIPKESRVTAVSRSRQREPEEEGEIEMLVLREKERAAQRDVINEARGRDVIIMGQLQRRYSYEIMSNSLCLSIKKAFMLQSGAPNTVTRAIMI